MRGKRRNLFYFLCFGRIIPAHAGQTRALACGMIGAPDHPRACGANQRHRASRRRHGGSSPRMRGKRRRFGRKRVRFRIIPAHAGQTPTSTKHRCSSTDHPRACGANAVVSSEVRPNCGSSPRMRGKHVHRAVDAVVGRIIPAHAGQTNANRMRHLIKKDHPRACGANSFFLTWFILLYGSSPRMRGKRSWPPSLRHRRRIIPAHAGQTVRFYAKTLERWTLNNWIRTVAPIFVLLFLPPVIGQNAYIERHYSNQSFSWFSKLHYASAFDLSLVA